MNATHEVVPVVEEEVKEVTKKDPVTGAEKKEIVKVPVVKNKIVAKKTPLVAAGPAVGVPTA